MYTSVTTYNAVLAMWPRITVKEDVSAILKCNRQAKTLLSLECVNLKLTSVLILPPQEEGGRKGHRSKLAPRRALKKGAPSAHSVPRLWLDKLLKN